MVGRFVPSARPADRIQARSRTDIPEDSRCTARNKILHAPDATGNYPNDGVYKGSVVFAGFGITAPELHYDDYAGIDARGKVVLVFNHEPQEDDENSIFNGKGNTRYANARAKMMIARRHGAVALLVAARSESSQRPGARSRSTIPAGANLGAIAHAAPDSGDRRRRFHPRIQREREGRRRTARRDRKNAVELQSAIDAKLANQHRPRSATPKPNSTSSARPASASFPTTSSAWWKAAIPRSRPKRFCSAPTTITTA